MPKRVAVVTGSNKGIGFAIVKLLMQRKFDGDVILCSRDESRGQEAIAKMKADHNLEPKFHQLDVDDDTSVKNLKEFLIDNYGGLDVLVNNAGIAFKGSSTASFAEQAEVTVRTNYFGVLRVCNYLFPILRDHARVVHLSSFCGHLSKIPGEEKRKQLSDTDLAIDGLNALMNEFVDSAKDGTAKDKGWGGSTYNVSKVGLTALGFIQQRALDKDPRKDIIVNMVNPGFVDTDMSSHKGPLTPDQGADAATYLAMLPANDALNPKGQYVWNDRKVTEWDSDTHPPAF